MSSAYAVWKTWARREALAFAHPTRTSLPAVEQAADQPAAVERFSVDIVERAEPRGAGALPDHVAEAEPRYRVDHTLPVDVGADHAHRRHQRECVAAGADHELRRSRAAEVDGLEEMDVAG